MDRFASACVVVLTGLAGIAGCGNKAEADSTKVDAAQSKVSLEEVFNLGSSEVNLVELTAQEFDYPDVGLSVGRGWNSYLSQPRQSVCVTGTSAPLQVNSNSVTYNDVYDREQLLNSMRISTKASFGSVASGRASFSRDVKIDKSVRNIVATVDVIYNGESLAPQVVGSDGLKQIALVPSALAILNNKAKPADERLEDFYRMCGDGYVAAIHNGARLNALFSLSLNEEETKQSFSASASGGFGGFSGGASAQNTIQRNKTSNQLRFVQTHWGGPAGTANTPQEMLNRIDTFTKLTPEQAKPFSVWITTYRHAANWPKEFLYSGLTARTVSLMAGQVWRLQDLGELYADAATAPHRYYFPFTDGQSIADFQKRAVERSDALYGASACFQNLTAYCAERTRCDMKEIFKPETISRVCPALKDASEGFRVTVTTAMVGSLPRPILQELDVGVNKDVEAASKEFKSLTPAEVYYRLLAEAPIRRSWAGATQDTRDALDASKQLEWYCAVEKLACADIVYEKLAGDVAPPAGAKSLLKTWIVRTKLLPLSSGFCRIPGHPMCLSQAQLSGLVEQLDPKFGKTRNFVLAPPPPPPAAPPPRERPEKPLCPPKLCW